jgi:predicted ATPase
MNTALEQLTHVGEHGEYVLDFLERHERDLIPSVLHHPQSQGETLKYNVDAWLEEISPNVKFSHLTDAKRDISYATFDEFRPPNVGFGLSYTLPVIVLLLGMTAQWQDNNLKTGRDVLVLLENPEAHLHPRCQTTMGKLIALTVATGVQVMVETHSDHLMDGIRIAVKENLLPASKTAFHYFTLENGFSQIESPQLHDNGKLDYWPQGFFDQTMKNRAILARR